MPEQAVSTATRGRVTRRAAPRSKRSTSNLVGTVRVWSHLLESAKSAGTCDHLPSNGIRTLRDPDAHTEDEDGWDEENR